MEGAFSTPVCARKQTNGPPSIDQGFSTGSYLATSSTWYWLTNSMLSDTANINPVWAQAYSWNPPFLSVFSLEEFEHLQGFNTSSNWTAGSKYLEVVGPGAIISGEFILFRTAPGALPVLICEEQVQEIHPQWQLLLHHRAHTTLSHLLSCGLLDVVALSTLLGIGKHHADVMQVHCHTGYTINFETLPTGNGFPKETHLKVLTLLVHQAIVCP